MHFANQQELIQYLRMLRKHGTAPEPKRYTEVKQVKKQVEKEAQDGKVLQAD